MISILALSLVTASSFEMSGRWNSWSYYESHEWNSTTVALIYDSISNDYLGAAVGADIAVECAVAGRTCIYRKLSGNEIIVEHVSDSGRETIVRPKDIWLGSLGGDVRLKKDDWSARVNTDIMGSFLGERALTGHRKFRLNAKEIFAQRRWNQWIFSAGRRRSFMGITSDGATALYDFSQDEEARVVGAYAGLAPNPITKMFSKDFVTVGSTVRWIPSFSKTSETKLRLEGDLVSNLYKKKMNRLDLVTRVHFTPIQKVSFIQDSTLALPWMGSDGNIKSTFYSLNSLFRPDSQWFFSVGFTQFRIHRYLEDASVRWFTDEGGVQSLRLGDTLDRSHRYRFDARASYRAAVELQPFTRFRYELRTFDDTKIKENSPLEVGTEPPANNLGLVGGKDAYRLTAGVRLFLFDQRLHTETSGTWDQRFRSKGWDANQKVAWNSDDQWIADVDITYMKASYKTSNGLNVNNSTELSGEDYYASLGIAKSFLSKWEVNLRYDFSYEKDFALDRHIFIHGGLIRVDHSF